MKIRTGEPAAVSAADGVVTRLTAPMAARARVERAGVFEAVEGTFDNGPDLVCLSHLRWNFVYQRPQHLMSRCARERRVFFFEEPVETDVTAARLELGMSPEGVCVAVPQVPRGLTSEETTAAQRALLDELFRRSGIVDGVLWYYTPMAIPFTRHIKPLATVFDCMDELSAFRGAPRRHARKRAGTSVEGRCRLHRGAEPL